MHSVARAKIVRPNNFPLFVNFVECAQKKTKNVGNGAIRTHELQNTSALNQQSST